ncbi:MAG: hypothetical protein ACP5IE_07095 [Infirmifilum sp.]|uniref:Uncharacterized protein n=1 Tax=Infirmifilum uzonense TaxID=1550241 RepID=A0A0F7FJ54_9CREN|nr:hypothetical protein [Infirmifilum uzonense]AKG39022.1 hypothetical protein MA03_06905 [Infirmifilum uzonense]
MAPKIKIEDTLPSGEKVTLSIEGGELDEAKILQLVSALKSLKETSLIASPDPDEESIKDKIWRIIVENFGDGTWFSLKDVYNLASRQIPDLKITAVSTYVTRLVSEGRLVKRGTKPNTRYRIKSLMVRDV